MKKAIILLTVLIFPIVSFCQQFHSVEVQKDNDQINMIINTITQGIKQNRTELILPYLGNQLRDYDDNILSVTDLKNRINRYFIATEKRKSLDNWSRLTPSMELPSNWDFEIELPTVLINGDDATTSFNFFWSSNIPLIANSTLGELTQTSVKKTDLWYFKKINNRWKLTKSQNLFRIMKLVSFAQ